MMYFNLCSLGRNSYLVTNNNVNSSFTILVPVCWTCNTHVADQSAANGGTICLGRLSVVESLSKHKWYLVSEIVHEY